MYTHTHTHTHTYWFVFGILGTPRVMSVIIIMYLFVLSIARQVMILYLTYNSLHKTIQIYYVTVCLGGLGWSSNLDSLIRLQLLQDWPEEDSACHDLLAEVAFSSLPSYNMSAGFVKAGEPASKTEVTVLCKLMQK